MVKKIFFAAIVLMAFSFQKSSDINETLKKVKEKYGRVDDYSATGKLKTNVIFIKAPVATVKVYYKKPDKLRIKNEKGISLIPKGTVNINLNNVLGLTDYETFDGGKEKVNGKSCQVIKIFPLDDKNDISRATLYVDETEMLVMKSVITSKDNGTYELTMSYDKQKSWALPDKVEFVFNIKEYKLPKGVTIDYDNGSDNSEANKKEKKGRVEIKYSNYSINKGISDDIFK